MHVSINWLKRHVDLDDLTPQQIAEDLTLSTCEVEGIERFAPHLAAVKVGHVLERAQHPDADKLSVCTVDVGDGEPLQIVCGAPNVGPGQHVAVATVGTVLPGEFKIKKSKIRGVESRGMICSVRELELGDEHDGIWVLPGGNGHVVGAPVSEALGLEDWVLEIDNKSLTHRPDLWGHRGIAGELAAIYGRELKPLDLALPELGAADPVPLAIDDPACSRYVGLSIDGVRNGPSPDWMRWLLLAVGQRPIDVVVDLSNFVMLDLGQPNHTFDRDALATEGIHVRKARAGERMTTLDEEERALQPSDLLICSGDEPVALAGVMGGQGSKIQSETGRLLLEVATFDPVTVRRTSSRLGLRTDSSSRFEKHLDPTLPEKAAAHFAHLLRQLQSDVTFPARLGDVGDWQDPALTLRLRGDVVRRDLGAEISDDEIARILTSLGFGVTQSARDFDVAVPSARATKDVTIERDLVEEVGRIHRYGSVPEAPIVAPIVPPARDERRLLVRRLQDRLAGAARFNEVMSYSFHSDGLLATLGIADEPHITADNPIAPELSRVRRDVLPSLLALVESNRRMRTRVRLFEVGKGYRPGRDSAEPREVHQVALLLSGPPLAKGARFDGGSLSELRGVVEDLVAHAGRAEPCWAGATESPSWAHPAKAVEARWSADGGPAALVAELEPAVARALGLEGELASDTAVAVLSIDALIAGPEKPPGYTPLPRYPGVKVDVALLAPDDLPAVKLVEAIEMAGKGFVRDVELFDLYRGESLGTGKKSLAYHVLLQSDTKTLTDKDAQKFLTRVERLVADRGAELRKA